MATGPTDTGKRGRLISWLEERLPIRLFIDTQLTGYFAPSNFNVWYYFGVLALVLLVVQFATGVFLAMFYKPAEAAAFDSVQYIMREVEWGWLLEAENFEPADPLSTPEHIAPVWYFTPYYAILRAIPDQRLGALLMLLAVASFLFLPWLDRSRVRSMRHKGWLSRIALAAFVISFIALGFLGLQAAEGAYVVLARILTVVYFDLLLAHAGLHESKPGPGLARAGDMSFIRWHLVGGRYLRAIDRTRGNWSDSFRRRVESRASPT